VLSVEPNELSVIRKVLSVEPNVLSVIRKVLSVEPNVLSVEPNVLSVIRKVLSVEPNVLSVVRKVLSVQPNVLTEVRSLFLETNFTETKQNVLKINIKRIIMKITKPVKNLSYDLVKLKKGHPNNRFLNSESG
jgi:DNA-directed RNA polymerase subunit F